MSAPSVAETDLSALYAGARFSECLTAIESSLQSPAVTLIRMRCLLFSGQHHELLRAELRESIEVLPAPERARAYGLSSAAFYQADMRVAGDNALAAAYELAERLNDDDALAEIRYHHALHLWRLEDMDGAARLVDQIHDITGLAAQALELRAWIAAKRGDFSSQHQYLESAWNAATSNDTWCKGKILHALTAIIRERYHRYDASDLGVRARSLAWSDDMRTQRFYVQHNLGWCAALDGQTLNAYDHFTDLASLCSNDAERTLMLVDKAFLATGSGDDMTANRYLEDASVLAQSVVWAKAGEARSALLLLGQLWAPRDPQTARGFVEAYCALAAPLSPLIGQHAPTEPRRIVFEQSAAAVVYRASGMRGEAIEAFKQVLSLSRKYGFHWRGCLAAIQLGEMLGRDSYFQYACTLVDEHFPRAWFAGRLRGHRIRLTHPYLRALSPARRDVLRGVLDGLSNDEIAARLKISPNLVKKRASEIYKKLGVSSDRALLRALSDRGIR
jgi:DNA-binding CsgD family transcriptional regulator